jgi:16S rRNA (uracil1498-N3)-methyltransferase
VFDGQGCVGLGALEIQHKAVLVRIISIRDVPPVVPRIDVAVALPKGSRVDQLVEQLSQLGANKLIPLLTQRTVVHPRETKLDRLQRAAIESAKQCGRSCLMTIDKPITLQNAIKNPDADPYDFCLIAHRIEPKVEENHDDFITARERASRILVLIGPEGGWSDEELTLATAQGCRPWCLGPHIMRVETAAAAVVAILRFPTSE